MNKQAFSLIELMVVIGIIALLTTIAAPVYVNHMNRSKVALAALVLNELNTKGMALYNEGLITPGVTSLNIDGTTWNDDTPIAYDRYPVTMAQVLFPGNGYLNNNAWMFCVYVADLSFDGYGGPGGGRSRLCSKVVVQDGIFTTYCGQWDENSPFEIPLEYLPDECDVPNISSY